jgi:hypothetical protein
MQPYNYIPQTQSPFDAYAEGLQIRSAQDQAQSMMDARKAKADQLKAQMEAAKLAEAEKQRFIELPDASIQDVIRFSSHLPADMVKAMQPQFDAMGKERSGGLLRFGGEVVSAIKGNRPEIAIELLKSRAQAEKDPQQAAGWNRAAQMIEVSPALAFKSFAPMLAAVPGGKELLENIDKAMSTDRAEQLQPSLVTKGVADASTAQSESLLKGAQAVNATPLADASLQTAQGTAQKAQAEGKYAADEAKARLAKSGWDIKALQNQIGVSSARLGLDRQIASATIMEKLANVAKAQDKMTSMPTDVRKSINDAAVTSGTAQMQAQKLEKLATDYLASGAGSGFGAKANEWFKKQGGYENGLTTLRNDYERTAKMVALKSLPPGPASNADLLFAMKGVPDATANPASIASFLRGMAIMERIASDTDQAKIDWLSNNGGAMTKAGGEFSAAGVTVKPGQSFAEVQSELVKKHATKPSSQANTPTTAKSGSVAVTVNGRSFNFPSQQAADAFKAAAAK